MPDCSIVRKSWDELSTTELYAFLKLRTDVFFVEQKVDEEELDWRDTEPTTEHYFIADEVGTAAYLRTLVDAQAEHLDAHRVIGRVVTRADRRGEGLASKLLDEVLSLHGHEPLMLHAQEYVAPLYAKAGFVAFGEPYMEAGISHLSMYRAGVEAR
jgi:ElaA protein